MNAKAILVWKEHAQIIQGVTSVPVPWVGMEPGANVRKTHHCI